MLGAGLHGPPVFAGTAQRLLQPVAPSGPRLVPVFATQYNVRVLNDVADARHARGPLERAGGHQLRRRHGHGSRARTKTRSDADATATKAATTTIMARIHPIRCTNAAWRPRNPLFNSSASPSSDTRESDSGRRRVERRTNALAQTDSQGIPTGGRGNIDCGDVKRSARAAMRLRSNALAGSAAAPSGRRRGRGRGRPAVATPARSHSCTPHSRAKSTAHHGRAPRAQRSENVRRLGAAVQPRVDQVRADAGRGEDASLRSRAVDTGRAAPPPPAATLPILHRELRADRGALSPCTRAALRRK